MSNSTITLFFYKINEHDLNTILLIMNTTEMSEIRDPIHKFIHYNDYEERIIDSNFFQRLKYIHQLGLGYCVYPGASHKRFEHSLGVMELGSKLFDILTIKNKDILFQDQISLFKDEHELEKYKQMFRLACLLHDIGHYPFSHGTEAVWGKDHEKIGSDIIIYIFDELINNHKKHDFLPEEIAFVATGEPKINDAKLILLKDMLQGDLGVDRIDYLIRDSLHTGVLYGMFDYHRLLDTFTLFTDQEQNIRLGLEKGGVYAAEGLILARYFMFTQVYFHRTRRIYDIHLGDYLAEFLNYQADIKFDYRDLEKNNLRKFLDLNDIFVLSQMIEDFQAAENNQRTYLAKMILGRHHHRCVQEVDGTLFPDFVNPQDVYGEIKRSIMEKYSDEMAHKEIIFDTSKKALNKFEIAEFDVYNPDTGGSTSILSESALMKKLKNVDLFRVYIKYDKEDIRCELRKMIDQIVGDHKHAA